MPRLGSLLRDRRGAAAAEMALVAPLLILLMFSSFEVGKFFWDEHTVTKAVRDGARYAAKQSFASMPCGGTATNESQIRNVVRYGTPVVTGSDKPLLYYWDDATTVTVAIDCYDNGGSGGARVYNGIYTARTTVPWVRVTATVPYPPLLTIVGLGDGTVSLHASSQATVFGR